MRRLRLAVCALVAALAVAVVAIGWLDGVPEISAAEASRAAQAAFDRADLAAVIDSQPTASTYASSTRPAVEVWTVRATVRSAPVALLLARSGAQPVQIDDRTPNGSGYVLSEIEYGVLAEGVEDPALRRIVARNITLTVAAVLVVAVSLALGLCTASRTEDRE